MTREAFDEQMRRYEFQLVGQILEAEGRIRCRLDNPPTDTGYVYLWVELAGGKATVVYVGKAGRTLAARCQQHTQGFRDSSTGRAHAERIRRGMKKACEYLIYARKSPVGTVCSEPGIPMAAVEELAFIRKFEPSWNALT